MQVMLTLSELSTLKLLVTAANYIQSEEYVAAEALCEEVIKRNESLAVAFTCKAQIYADQNNHERAIELYKEALEHGSDDDAVIRYYMALSLFSIGRHKEGWYNLYISRTECETFEPLYVARKRFTKPMFNMQPLPATVHIHTD